MCFIEQGKIYLAKEPHHQVKHYVGNGLNKIGLFCDITGPTPEPAPVEYRNKILTNCKDIKEFTERLKNVTK